MKVKLNHKLENWLDHAIKVSKELNCNGLLSGKKKYLKKRK